MPPRADKRSHSDWRAAAVLALSVCGFALSFYSVEHHINVWVDGDANFTCNINSALNCDEAARSEYSRFLGMPLGAWGAAYFVATALLLVAQEGRRRGYLQYAIFGAGSIVAVGLGLVSAILLPALCPTCILIHVVVIAQAFLALQAAPYDNRKIEIGRLLVVGAISLVTLVAFRSYTNKELDLRISKSVRDSAQVLVNADGASQQLIFEQFGDFLCPICSDFSPTFLELKKRYAGRVEFKFRYFPLENRCNDNINADFHPGACDVAIVVSCAAAQGKFWDLYVPFMQDYIASGTEAEAKAIEIGVDAKSLRECLDSGAGAKAVAEDVMRGRSLGVKSTPVLFLNGQRVQLRRDIDTLSRLLDATLGLR